MTAQQWDWPKAPVYQEWERMKPGLYKLRYEDHDLAISKERGSDYWRKLYTIWIDGVAVAKEWSAGQSKSKAIQLVNLAHKEGKPIVPSDEVTDEITIAEYLPEMVEPTPCFPRSPAAVTVDSLRQAQFEIEAIQSQKADNGSLYFSITGKLDLSSLATLTTTVELLRENGGQVSCDVSLPSRITL